MHNTVYIGGKVTDLPDYRGYFDMAQRKLEAEGYLCMNPAILPEGFDWEVYLPICYAMIDACETIYFLKNWKDSKGAKMEYEYAKSKNKVIVFET